MQKLVKQVNTQKSTSNPMSSFGLIEENMELSHIHLAAHQSRHCGHFSKKKYYNFFQKLIKVFYILQLWDLTRFYKDHIESPSNSKLRLTEGFGIMTHSTQRSKGTKVLVHANAL
jgi:hypothetical protein